jgi:RNA polymerase sigma-70 factor (ECF subfamily)
VTEEKDLVDRLSRGEEPAFRELVSNYKKKVYFLALDMMGNHPDAEDVSQEVFLKVFRSFRTFKRDAKLGSWLYRVTYNACIDHLRKRAVTPEPLEDDILELSYQLNPQPIPMTGVDPAAAAEQAILQTRINQALQKISAQERAVFILRHYEGRMLGEIAETLNLSIGSVKSYLFRAIKKLQRELGVNQAESGLEVPHD